MTPDCESLPTDLAAAHAMILAERAARLQAEAVAAHAQAVSSSTQALIAHLKLQIEKLRRELYGSRSERKVRLLEQMELQLEDLEASATEDEIAAETGCHEDAGGADLRAPAAVAQTLPRSPATRAHRRSRRRTAAPAAARPGCRSWART